MEKRAFIVGSQAFSLNMPVAFHKSKYGIYLAYSSVQWRNQDEVMSIYRFHKVDIRAFTGHLQD